jgi:hypothetical protein
MSDLDKQIKALIEMQVVQALLDTPTAIEQLVKAAIEGPVDATTGGRNSYSSNKVPYLEYCANDCIRGAIRSAVIKVIQERTSTIETIVGSALSEKNVIESMAQAIVNAAQREWYMEINFKEKRTE